MKEGGIDRRSAQRWGKTALRPPKSSMTSPEDYYALLGLSPDATDQDIRTAFKRLARRYHPDVYSGPDADERMRKLIVAYQTLRDPQKRRIYDQEHRRVTQAAGHRTAVRDTAPPDMREFIFPDLEGAITDGLILRLQGSRYMLSGPEVAQLLQKGMLYGRERPKDQRQIQHCHRCGHDWFARQESSTSACPSCHARDWDEYLLLRCIHCRAIFESAEVHEYQVREVKGQLQFIDHTCTPYELYPLCPNCRAGGWCLAEEQRLAELRKQQRLMRRIAQAKVALALVTLAIATSAVFYFLIPGIHH
jgi:hypothetical protein